MPDRVGAFGSPAAGRPMGLPGLPGQDDRLGQAVQPWLVNQSWHAQSWQFSLIGQGIEAGRFVQPGQESPAGQSATSGAGTPLASLPLMARLPLVASLPPLAALASLGGAAGLSRLASAHGAGPMPQAALVLLAGAFALTLAGRRRRGVRGLGRGAMTS
jgi:hypothetical protein